MRIILVLLFILISSEAHALIQNLKLSTYSINKSRGFEGTNIMLSGVRASNANILIAVTGPAIGYEIWKKEPFFGLWRNAKKFTIPAIFSFLQVSYSGNWDGDQDAILKRLNLDLNYSDFSPVEKHTVSDIHAFNIFMESYYKKSELLSIAGSNVEMFRGDEFKLVIKIPGNAPLGKFDVKIYQFNDKGEVFDTDSTSFEVVQSTIDYQIKNFATDYPIQYATIAVVMAIIIGLSMGYLFNGFKHHPKK